MKRGEGRSITRDWYALYAQPSFLKVMVLFAVMTVTSLNVMAEGETVVVKVGSVAPEGTPWSAWLKNVKKKVSAESQGQIKYKIFLGGRLGGEISMVEDVKRGRLQMFGGSIGAIASKYAPELGVFELPMIFSSNAEADFVLNELRDEVRKRLESKGFIFVMWAENGWHGLGSKGKCLDNPDAIAGYKIRSQESPIHMDTLSAFGAAPASIPVPEVLSSLQTGVVNGFSNTPIFTFATSWYKGINHFAYTKHIYQPGGVIISKKWFDTLSPEHQAILRDGSLERDGIKKVRRLTKPLLENLGAAGVKVCDVSAESKKALASKAKGVWKKFAARSKANASMLAKVKAAKAKFH